MLLLHKPAGATSFSLVRELQERLAATPGKAHALCHGGALDPFAHGLLPLLVGPAVRLFEHLHELPKRYVAEVRWGSETESGDALGRVVREAATEHLTPARLDAALAAFLGWTAQVPPARSNKRVDGERAWRRALRGEAVELPPARVYLHSARWRSHALPAASTLELACRGGFYVRSLAVDVARAMESAAHLGALHREAVGPWLDPGPGEERFVAGPDVAPWLSWRALSDDEWGLVRRGQPVADEAPLGAPEWTVPPGFPPPTPLVRAVHQGRLVALLARRGRELVRELSFPGGLDPARARAPAPAATATATDTDTDTGRRAPSPSGATGRRPRRRR